MSDPPGLRTPQDGRAAFDVIDPIEIIQRWEDRLHLIRAERPHPPRSTKEAARDEAVTTGQLALFRI